MIQQKLRTTAFSYLVSDLVFTLAAFGIAWLLRFELGIGPEFAVEEVPDFVRRYVVLLPFIVVVWPIAFYFHGLYLVRRGRSRIEEVLTVALSVLLAILLLSVFTAWYRPEGALRPDGSREIFTYSRLFLVMFAACNVVTVSTGRMLIRGYLRRARLSGAYRRNILVLGAGALGQDIASKIAGHADLGFHLAGYLDDDSAKQGNEYHDAQVLGRLDQLQAILQDHEIDLAFIALPLDAHRKVVNIVDILGRECVEVRLVPDILQYATLKATLEDLDGTPVINLSQVPLQGWKSLGKRAMDISVAGTALLAGTVTLILPALALAIWLEDRGPIFYHQERMGLDGKKFTIHKFRSMRSNAELTTGPVWAVEDDPRRTRVGAWMRRWSIDELPQLWNIFRGEMSLIGPRPERPDFVEQFKHRIPQYMLRHRVKAGLTGWAQVHGWRGNTSINKRIQYDIYYIENWSLKLDLKILWMTLREMRTNAY